MPLWAPPAPAPLRICRRELASSRSPMRVFRKATSMMSPSRVRPLIIQRGKENCPLLFGKGGGVGKRALPILPPVSFRAILLEGTGPSLPPPVSKPPLSFLPISSLPHGPTALQPPLPTPPPPN